MRDYELLLVIRPTLDSAAAVDLSKEISEMVKARQGAISATNVWGRRKLAYPIDNQIEATYILQKIQIPPAQLPDLEFNLKLNESLLRYMIVRDHQPAETELQETETSEDASAPEPASVPEASAPDNESTSPSGDGDESASIPDKAPDAAEDDKADTKAETVAEDDTASAVEEEKSEAG